ncbi:MAG: hypothetical protein PHP45_02335 [Elusimicrobiales bacterium]|nr:hypothetical protein [Elusimicrobiales bacterium]
MNFQEFKTSAQNMPIVTGKDAVKMGNRQTMYNQLMNWQKKGLLVQLRRGLYTLGKTERKIEPSNLFLAGQIYSPSYVSLEYALGLYGLIPEMVVEVTSVTTRNPARFQNDFGKFSYQHIKHAAFRGFKTEKDRAGLAYFIAEPEKAVADFIYLNLPRFKAGDKEIFSASYRFQNLESLNLEKLANFAAQFENTKLDGVISMFCEFIKEELRS